MKKSAGLAPQTNDVVSIDDLLRDAGFGAPSAQRAARRALEDAGITRTGKRGIAAYKREKALAVLAKTFVVVCGAACRTLAPATRHPVIGAGLCEICQGSNNRRAMLAAARALRDNGVKRVLIVGGRGEQHRQIAAAFRGEGVVAQGVIGTSVSHTQKDAQANMRRAGVMIIRGATELRHAVSKLYASDRPDHLRVIQIGRRGTEALCAAIVESFARRRS
jgi:hypothetical protein